MACLRLLGNVRVGEDLTIPEINAHAAAGDLPAELQRRGVAFTYWEGLCDATLPMPPSTGTASPPAPAWPRLLLCTCF